MSSTRPAGEEGSPIEWPTVGILVLTYGGWCAAGLLLWPAWPVPALGVMTMFTLLHASLVHETVHGHPTRHPLVNEALVFLPLGLLWPYRRFRALHLRHHVNARLTDPVEDPESGYCAAWRFRTLPRWRRVLLVANNTLAGRLVVGPLLSVSRLVAGDLGRLRRSPGELVQAWLLHGAGVAPVIALVHWGFGINIVVYVLTVVWGAHGLLSLRTFAEHRWHARPEARCVIVEPSRIAMLYLNNNLHLVHHCHPSVPWYQLPAMYRARREHWHRLGRGYVIPGYRALIRAYAFRIKEPVVHPELARHRPCREALRGTVG